MSPRKEFFLILFISFAIPMLAYPVVYSFFQNNEEYVENVSASLEELQKTPEPISLLFVGDIMLDRTIRADGEVYGYANLFSCLAEEFARHDEVIGNLEGTVTNFESVSKGAPYESPQSFRFTFDVKAVQALVDIGLSTVSLANNHIRDFGDDGIAQTVAHANEIHLSTFGSPQQGSVRYVIKDVHGTKIAFIPYNQFFGTPEQVTEDLELTKPISDIQIIFAHWGDEYVPARADIKSLAHTFVDQGADLVIGAHPHVIQESEVYRNVPIYYSLGNFIFDQYWEEAVRTGKAVVVSVVDKKIAIEKELVVESTRHEGSCFKKALSQ